MSAALYTRSFLLLIAAHFLQALGFSSMVLLPLFVAHLGGSNTEIGVVMATAAVGGLLVRPAIAFGLDRIGRRPTLVLGTVALSVSMGLFAFINRVGPLMFFSRALLGMGTGALFSGYFTFAADLVPESRRTEGLAIFGVSGLIPLLVNPFVDRMGLSGAEIGRVFPWLGALVFGSLLPLLMVPEDRSSSSVEPLSLRQVLDVLAQPTLRPIWFITFVFSGSVAVFMSFATVTAQRRGVDFPAALWLTYTLGAASVRILGGKLPDRLGPARIVPPALMSYAAAMAAIAMAHSSSQFLIAGLLAGFGHGYCFPILTAQLVGRVPFHARGSSLATLTAIWELMALFCAPMFGAIADFSSAAVMFGLAAVISAVSLLVWAPLERRALTRLSAQ